MVKRTTLLAVQILAVLIAAWLPVTSFALGLGPITMRSALNQPLHAEIDIHSAQPGDLDGLAVRLATGEDFARVNVERTTFLTKILFKVQLRSDGSPYIMLTTQEPVTEPYLDFLIEARWARGRALKEYTVLVDPPVLTQETPAPVQQSATAPVFSQPETKPAQAPKPVRSKPAQPRQQRQAAKPRRPAAPRRVPTPTRQVADIPEGTTSYRVQRNDTLYEIAKKMRPDESATLNQTMMALLRANPRAFYNNNINQLKAGVVLRLDDPDVVNEISKRQANAAFREQMAAWREGRPTRLVQQVDTGEAASAGEGMGDGATMMADGEGAVSEDARLKLVAPGQEGLGSGSAGDDELASENQRLQQELILATEALDANRVETDELKARLSELEEQLQSMQRLINLKDEEMLAIQQGMKEQQEGAGAKPEQPEPAQAEAAKPKPAPAAPAAAEEESIVDILMSDTTIMGGVAIAVLGVVAWLVVRRRKMQEGFQESILNVGMADTVAGMDSTQPGGGSSMVSDFAMSGMEPIQTDTAEVDPISEADVYLAYGRHQQAEDIIKQALESTPDRLELHAKLLEVMHAANNRAGFEEHAQILHDKIGGDESNEVWAKVAALGSQIAPNNPLFGSSAGDDFGGDDLAGQLADVTTDEEDLLDFDFDENEAFDIDGGGSTATASASDDDLDFDVSSLDFDLGEDSTDQAIANIDSLDEANDNSIDFDLSDEKELEITESSQMIDPGEELLSLDDDDEQDAIDSFDLDTSDTAVAQEAGSELSLEGVGETAANNDLSLEDDSMSAGGLDMGFDHGSEAMVEDDTVVALDTGAGGDEELSEDIFADVDEIGTKLDLAKAYVDMGDSDGARSILDEVLEEGDDTQKQQAEQLLQQMG